VTFVEKNVPFGDMIMILIIFQNQPSVTTEILNSTKFRKLYNYNDNNNNNIIIAIIIIIITMIIIIIIVPDD